MITELFKKSPKQPDPALMELAQSNPVLYMMQLDREETARSKRLRWILISSIIMLYILVLFVSTGHPRAALQRATQGFGNLFEEKPYASMVKITGQITPDGPTSFASLLPSLEGAFADANAAIDTALRDRDRDPAPGRGLNGRVAVRRIFTTADGSCGSHPARNPP